MEIIFFIIVIGLIIFLIIQSEKDQIKKKLINKIDLEDNNIPIKNKINNTSLKKKSIKKTKTYHRIKYAYHGLRCFSRGLNSGEHIVVEYLAEKLDMRRYYIFNNLTLITKDGSTQIDHVVISPYGIFVIETKDYSGWIFGDKIGKIWTQTLLGNNKYTFQNPFRQNYKHIKTLQEYLPFVQSSSFKTVIALGRTADFKTERPDEVRYFDEIADYIKVFDRQELSKTQFFMTIGKLSQLCQSTDISPEEHIDNLTKEHTKL